MLTVVQLLSNAVKEQCGVNAEGSMNRSFRCQTCDKRRTSLNVSLYTSRLTGLGQDRKLIEKVHVFNLHQMYVHAKFRHFVRSHSTLHEAIRNISFSFLKKILVHSW